MTEIQVEKLYIFYFLYNGCDSTCNLLGQSPDYLIEKWNKIIGIDPPEVEYPELKNKKTYQEWQQKWVKTDKNIIPDSLMMFLVTTHPNESNGRYNSFLTLINQFEKYIGKPTTISEMPYNHIHPNFLEKVRNIIKVTLKPDDLREIKLSNLLS
jgi:hypothetical protein